MIGKSNPAAMPEEIEKTLRERGFLFPGENPIGFIPYGGGAPPEEGHVLTDRRFFSVGNGEIREEIPFDRVKSARCAIRYKRNVRYELILADDRKVSLLLSAEPLVLQTCVEAIDEQLSRRDYTFKSAANPLKENPFSTLPSIQAPREDSDPKKSEKDTSLPEEGPRFAPGSNLPRLSLYRRDTPARSMILAVILCAVGLYPVFGFPLALIGLLIASLTGLESEGSDPEANRKVLLACRILTSLSFLILLSGIGVHLLRTPGQSLFRDNLVRTALFTMNPENQVYVGYAMTVFVLLFSVSWHEAAHALSALWNGDSLAQEQGRITLNPIHHIHPFGSILLPALLLWSSGGSAYLAYAKPCPTNPARYRNYRLGMLTVPASGPGTNILLLFGALGIHFMIVALGGAILTFGEVKPSHLLPLYYLGNFFLRLVQINLFLAVFNMLPIPPLDGFHVLSSLLPDRISDTLRGLEGFGFILLLLVLMSGFLTPLFRLVSHSTFLLLGLSIQQLEWLA